VPVKANQLALTSEKLNEAQRFQAQRVMKFLPAEFTPH